MLYYDAAGQLYLHLPLVPTVVVVATVLILFLMKVLLHGLFTRDRDVVLNSGSDEEREPRPDDRVVFEPKLHANSKVRHLDL